MAGDGSEGRYDGESMAKKGIVAITVNYRLGVFRLFAHAELTKESPQRARQLRPVRSARRSSGCRTSGLRRRPEASDDCGRIRRLDRGQRADGLAAVEEPDRGDRRKRLDPGRALRRPTWRR